MQAAKASPSELVPKVEDTLCPLAWATENQLVGWQRQALGSPAGCFANWQDSASSPRPEFGLQHYLAVLFRQPVLPVAASWTASSVLGQWKKAGYCCGHGS